MCGPPLYLLVLPTKIRHAVLTRAQKARRNQDVNQKVRKTPDANTDQQSHHPRRLSLSSSNGLP